MEYQDSNANGVYDKGEPLIASDTTDSSGLYLFTDSDGLQLNSNIMSDNKKTAKINAYSVINGNEHTRKMAVTLKYTFNALKVINCCYWHDFTAQTKFR